MFHVREQEGIGRPRMMGIVHDKVGFGDAVAEWTTSMSPSDVRRIPLSRFLPNTRGLPCSS